METIAQIVSKDKNILSLDYPFDELKIKQQMFFKTPEEEMNVRMNNLKDIIKIFNEENILYWLQGKTLLGLYKNKRLIENDHDEDIGTDIKNLDIVARKIIPKLESIGFVVIRCPKDNSMVSVIRNLRYIDICFFKHRGRKYGYQKKFFPAKYYQSYTIIEIDDFEYKIPTYTKDIIKFSYNITF